MEETQVKTETLVQSIVESIHAKRGMDVVTIDMRRLNSSVCDFFVICSGSSDRQVKAIADYVEDEMKHQYETSLAKKQGYENGQWVVLDYLDTVVHIFQQEYRDFYRLEELWADADIKEYSDQE